MSRWFRFYDDAINDPKILKLSDKLHRIWVGILCVASKNNGVLPPLSDTALMIRMKPEKLEEAIQHLINVELIDDSGVSLRPHNWDKRQYKSDVSTERVKRFRNGNGNVSETPPETETENRSEQKVFRRVAKATAPNPKFDEFWKAYPSRKGDNPKSPARKLFEAFVKQGVDPDSIILGLKNATAKNRDKVGTEFIPMAETWLRQRRWEEHINQSVVPLQQPEAIDSTLR